jgi:hypothetical protein
MLLNGLEPGRNERKTVLVVKMKASRLDSTISQLFGFCFLASVRGTVKARRAMYK